MKIKNLFLGFLTMAALWSCDPNHPDSVYVNTAPVIKDQSFSAKEDISDAHIIGTVTAKDEVDDDKITFSIYTDNSGLFEISLSGNLTLIQGKHLDFETAETHTITVRAYDGIVGRYANVTIAVEDVEPEPDSPTVVLENASLELYTFDMETLGVTTTNAGELTIGWASDNEEVATVDQDGNVTAIAVGTTIITATLGKSSSSATITVVPNVYVAGSKVVNGINVAILWINGDTTAFTEGLYHTYAYSVFVSDTDIYVAGQVEIGGERRARLWKNGESYPLEGAGDGSGASSVYVNDDNVYAAGFIENQNNITVAALWENGVLHELTDGSDFAVANDVFVQDNDVYLAGQISNSATLWKNMNLIESFGGNPNLAHSVYADGTNVYVAGSEIFGIDRKAMLWENGLPTELTTDDNLLIADANSVFVYEGNVYVAGIEDNIGYKIKLWTNGLLTHELTDGSSYALVGEVFVYDGDIFVSGSVNETGTYVAKIWVNGVPMDLTDGSTDARANAVFVK